MTQEIRHGAHRNMPDPRGQEVMRGLLALKTGANASLFRIGDDRAKIAAHAVFSIERRPIPIGADGGLRPFAYNRPFASCSPSIMPADDHPIDALKKQFQLEDSAVSPVTKMFLAIASWIPLPPPLNKFIESLREHLAADSLDRVRLLLETIVEEVKKHESAVQWLRDDEGIRGLALDAIRKAARTRAKERIQRIGLILAYAAIQTKPADDDETEEMMRVATDLSDSDVTYLRELVRIEGAMLEGRHHIPRYDAYAKWDQGNWGNSVEPAIDSAFSKLESYGLVTRLAPPNHLNALADFQNRYVLLPKGLHFVNLIRERVPQKTSAMMEGKP